MVVEPRQPLQPQQGHTELSSHLFQLFSADLKTLRRTCTYIKENSENYPVHPKELSHRKISQSGTHVQRGHISSIQLNLKPNFKSVTEIYIKMAAVGFF